MQVCRRWKSQQALLEFQPLGQAVGTRQGAVSLTWRKRRGTVLQREETVVADVERDGRETTKAVATRQSDPSCDRESFV